MATPTSLPASVSTGGAATSSWANAMRGAFRILQVVSASTTTVTAAATATYIDSTLTATITPQSSSSLILVVYSQNIYSSAITTGVGLRLLRSSTVLDTIVDLCYSTAGGVLGQNTMTFLDSPATTSATTYKTQMNRNSGTGLAYTQPNNNRSSIILFEVSA